MTPRNERSKSQIGSDTAKSGFDNETAICNKFNNWAVDSDAQQWLKEMGYAVPSILKVQASQIPTTFKKENLSALNIILPGMDAEVSSESFKDLVLNYKKADAQVSLLIEVNGQYFYENISLKRSSATADFNQVDKRSVDTYKKMWNIPDELVQWLKLMTGELKPTPSTLGEYAHQVKCANNDKLLLKEMPLAIQSKLINFLEDKKVLIVADVIKGRGCLSANWMLVTKYTGKSSVYSIKCINKVLAHLCQGAVEISARGSTFKIGRLSLQRKGGTPDPEKLQFKFKPSDIFRID